MANKNTSASSGTDRRQTALMQLFGGIYGAGRKGVGWGLGGLGVVRFQCEPTIKSKTVRTECEAADRCQQCGPVWRGNFTHVKYNFFHGQECDEIDNDG